MHCHILLPWGSTHLHLEKNDLHLTQQACLKKCWKIKKNDTVHEKDEPYDYYTSPPLSWKKFTNLHHLPKQGEVFIYVWYPYLHVITKTKISSYSFPIWRFSFPKTFPAFKLHYKSFTIKYFEAVELLEWNHLVPFKTMWSRFYIFKT